MKEEDFLEIIHNYNTTPRKSLGWLTPLKAFNTEEKSSVKEAGDIKTLSNDIGMPLTKAWFFVMVWMWACSSVG
jgi:hypothetical protein